VEEIEDSVKEKKWHDFEEFVGEIFRAHDFTVRKNVRFKGSRRYEIDLVASRGGIVICVDCKKWSKGRYKKSSLKKAAEQQEKRVSEFIKVEKINKKVVPLIVTLFEEDLLKEGDTLFVPLWKLNNFLCNLEAYVDIGQK